MKKSKNSRMPSKSQPAEATNTETVTLVSKHRMMQVFNLTKAEGIVRKFPVIRPLKNGSSVGEFQGKVCPDSLTLLVGERKIVPKTVLSAPELANAIRARKVVVIENRASK